MAIHTHSLCAPHLMPNFSETRLKNVFIPSIQFGTPKNNENRTEHFDSEQHNDMEHWNKNNHNNEMRETNANSNNNAKLHV